MQDQDVVGLATSHTCHPWYTGLVIQPMERHEAWGMSLHECYGSALELPALGLGRSRL